ncbi:MAG: NAD(P)/FAD-dependent oxidoreductase [Planctomycetota bacterium]
MTGAGLAGASAARSLAMRGRSVLLLESDRQPGMHASGRNAAILRRVIEDPSTATLAHRGGALLETPPDDLEIDFPLVRPHGVLLTAGSGPAGEQLRAATASARARGLDVEAIDGDMAVKLAPALTGAPPEVASWSPTDGVIDVAAVLDGMLRSAKRRGTILAPLCGSERVLVENGRVTGIETPRGTVETPLVVNAGGAWGNRIAEQAGLEPIGITPYRRHIFISGPHPAVTHGMPTVWDVDRGIYVRPEGTMSLISPCDQDPVLPDESKVNPVMRALLVDKMQETFPRFGRLVVRRIWAGLRTIATDGSFVIGPDPRLGGFAWLAGLGGHGVTTSLAVGDALVDLLDDGSSDIVDAAAVRPDRLLGAAV